MKMTQAEQGVLVTQLSISLIVPIFIITLEELKNIWANKISFGDVRGSHHCQSIRQDIWMDCPLQDGR